MKILIIATVTLLACCKCSVGYTASRTAILDVPGMNCATCPLTVKLTLSRVDGVREVDVSYKDKRAMVIYDDEITHLDSLIKATTNAGYPATPSKDNNHD